MQCKPAGLSDQKACDLRLVHWLSGATLEARVPQVIGQHVTLLLCWTWQSRTLSVDLVAERTASHKTDMSCGSIVYAQPHACHRSDTVDPNKYAEPIE